MMAASPTVVALLASSVVYGGINFVSAQLGEHQTLASQALCVMATRLMEERRYSLAHSAQRAAHWWDKLWLGHEVRVIRTHLTNLAVVSALMGDKTLSNEYTAELAQKEYAHFTKAGASRIWQRLRRITHFTLDALGSPQLRSNL
eukprot:TRINITY_DN20831_c0_g1_i3.p1 TRINITY_DN20831_c0_g1~~TRINITY_DN20831_c0_g1_i3.p1  ORF type:complete len:145 (+),score=22.93 TRINITY_DN20831_c0_g1_i3:2-436(+)